MAADGVGTCMGDNYSSRGVLSRAGDNDKNGWQFFSPAGRKLLSVYAELTLRCGVSAAGVPPVPITPRLSHKLHQALGEEAGAEFMAWMHHVDARVADVVTRGDLAEMRADLAELRQEVQVGFAKMHEEMARLETRFERRFGDLIKWSFVFWVGAVGAIAMLAGVVR